MRKVSTTGQRRQALAWVIRKVMKNEAVGDATTGQKFGCSRMVSRLVKAGFLERTETKGHFKPTDALQKWTATDILNLLYDRKNALETKVEKRLAKNGVQPSQPPVQLVFGQDPHAESVKERNEIKLGAQRFIEAYRAGQADFAEASGMVTAETDYSRMVEKINNALEAVQRFGIRDAAAYIAAELQKQSG